MTLFLCTQWHWFVGWCKITNWPRNGWAGELCEYRFAILSLTLHITPSKHLWVFAAPTPKLRVSTHTRKCLIIVCGSATVQADGLSLLSFYIYLKAGQYFLTNVMARGSASLSANVVELFWMLCTRKAHLAFIATLMMPINITCSFNFINHMTISQSIVKLY